MLTRTPRPHLLCNMDAYREVKMRFRHRIAPAHGKHDGGSQRPQFWNPRIGTRRPSMRPMVWGPVENMLLGPGQIAGNRACRVGGHGVQEVRETCFRSDEAGADHETK